MTEATPPAGWTRSTLGEIGEYHNGRGFKKSEWKETGRPIIRIQNLTGSGKDFNYFQGNVDDRHVVRRGDLLVSWAATLGVFKWDGPEAVLNQHIFKVESSIDPEFHRYLLEHTLDDLQLKTHGSGMVHITRGRFDETQVWIPPVEEQRRIVEAIETYLSHLDAGVESLERGKRNVERMRASILERAANGDLEAWSRSSSENGRFPDLESIRRQAWSELYPGKKYKAPASPSGQLPVNTPTGWIATSLDSVLAGLRYGTSTKCDYEGEGDPVLRIPNIREGRVISDDIKFAVDPGEDLESVRVRQGDVLFIRTNGSRELIGRVGVAGKEVTGMAYASYLIRGRPVDGVDPRFLGAVLESPSYRQHMNSLAATSAGQYNISASKLASIPISMPSTEEQWKIVEEVDRQTSLLDVLDREIDNDVQRAISLRRSILVAAFSGALRRVAV